MYSSRREKNFKKLKIERSYGTVDNCFFVIGQMCTRILASLTKFKANFL